MIFIANFKMMLTSAATTKLVNENLPSYKELAAAHTIILCPSTIALADLSRTLTNTSIKLGAQTCGAATAGAFTGEISAADLVEYDVTYCLVGHSERRTLFHETDDLVAIKTNVLIQHQITPVVCVGETLDQYKNNLTLDVLERQISYVLDRLNNNSQPILIAYEPVWAIGSGLVPTQEQLSFIFASLAKIIEKKSPNLRYKLLYGGSVSSKTIKILSHIEPLDGFLIGGASLDFQEFKKIVDYFN